MWVSQKNEGAAGVQGGISAATLIGVMQTWNRDRVPTAQT